jgi:uncharacterized membrane protein
MGEARLIFLATLRAGLRDAPPSAVGDILADYASHFDVGAAKGRVEEEIASALGDPLALADELRVEMRIDAWNEKRSPAAAAKLIAGVIGLGSVNAVLAFIALPLACLLVFMAVVSIVSIFGVGVWLAFAGVSLGLGQALSLLAGAGLVFAAITLSALLAILLLAMVSGLVRYARLHYRLLPRSGQPSPEQISKEAP